MRGLRDRDTTIATFVGTANRNGQRVVAQNEDFVLFSSDVSQAFAKGMTFEEYARVTGTQLRAVEFEVAAEVAELLRELPGFDDFRPQGSSTHEARNLWPEGGSKSMVLTIT